MRWPRFQFGLRLMVLAVALAALNLARVVAIQETEARRLWKLSHSPLGVYNGAYHKMVANPDGSIYLGTIPPFGPRPPRMVRGPQPTPLQIWWPSAASVSSCLLLLVILSARRANNP